MNHGSDLTVVVVRGWFVLLERRTLLVASPSFLTRDSVVWGCTKRNCPFPPYLDTPILDNYEMDLFLKDGI
jgi:hypothetical protein